MRIKLLHVITRLELGGAQKHVLEILSKVDQKCYQLYLIASDGLLSQEARRIKGVSVISLPFLRRRLNPFLDLLAFGFLFVFIRWHKIDIVHTHSSKAGILARWAACLARVPVIVHTVHGWGFYRTQKKLVYRFYILLERLSASMTTCLITLTQYDWCRGIKEKIGQPHQYALIRCGLDFSAFDSEPPHGAPPACPRSLFCRSLGGILSKDPRPWSGSASKDQKNLRKSLNISAGDRLVGMVACLKKQKNPLDFVRLADKVYHQYPNVRFILAGDGPLRKAVASLIHECGLDGRFFLLGWRRDVHRVLAELDVCVSTSLWEGLPLVFYEAMHCGVPMVAYDVCGVSELIKDGESGFLVGAGDVSAAADCVLRLLKDNRTHDRIKQFGQRQMFAKEFSSSFMMREIEALYTKLRSAKNRQ